MAYRAVSADTKLRALQLLDSGWKIEDIAMYLELDKKALVSQL
jgi:hypothetical protein